MTGADTIAPAVEWRTAPGLTDYAEAERFMRERAAAIRAGTAPELVWLLEHAPLLTGGTSARDADLLDGGDLPRHRVGRGGQWTFHGPGQRVAYVMLDLEQPHGTVPARDVRGFVAGLERWLGAALAVLGVAAGPRANRVGLWVDADDDAPERKIAAIGVRVTRWVTSHGIALNAAPDLDQFGRIVPCGLSDFGVTSLAALDRPAALAIVDAALQAAWAPVFGGTITERAPDLADQAETPARSDPASDAAAAPIDAAVNAGIAWSNR